MNVTLTIPEALASRILANGHDLGRQALEALLLESFRAGRVSTGELRELLDFGSLDELDGFLKAHGVYEPYTADEILRQAQRLAELGY